MSELGDCFKRVNASKIFSLPFSARNHHEEFRTKNYSKMYFYHARFIHCKWELKDFRKIIENEANLSELTFEGKMYGMFYARKHK